MSYKKIPYEQEPKAQIERPDLSRPHAIIEKDGDIDLFTGEFHEVKSLDEMRELQQMVKKDIVFVTPHSLIKGERGFEANTPLDPETGEPEVEPILVLVVHDVQRFTRDQIADVLGEANASAEVHVVGDIIPTVSDEDYAQRVTCIQDNAISRGEASQVVFSRAFYGQLESSRDDASISHACYARLLDQKGQYMTIFFSDASGRALVGATPERHLEIIDGKVLMNPIAGTMPKGDRETFPQRLFEFLDDRKEQNELFQVLDEEMKMMAEICPQGGSISGPFLRETGRVIHTEYLLTGERAEGQDVKEAFKPTLNASTLMGSPLQNAARLIAQNEPVSRGYYGGVIGISRFSEEFQEADALDSAIVIRTAVVYPDGQFFVRAGAGIVEGSVPHKEADETRRKAEGFLHAFTGAREERGDDAERSEEPSYLSMIDPQVLQEKLAARNKHLSKFHFERQQSLQPEETLKGKRIVILNNEDNFAFMLKHMVSHMGAEVTVVDSLADDALGLIDAADGVIIGPGPGDINDAANLRMVRLKEMTAKILENGTAVLGVCLGNQVLASALGMPVTVQGRPTQGQQREVDLFGKKEHLGFYNSFSAENVQVPEGVETCVDSSIDGKERVMAMRSLSRRMIGTQFHPESVMSENGYEILKGYLASLLGEKEEITGEMISFSAFTAPHVIYS